MKRFALLLLLLPVIGLVMAPAPAATSQTVQLLTVRTLFQRYASERGPSAERPKMQTAWIVYEDVRVGSVSPPPPKPITGGYQWIIPNVQRRAAFVTARRIDSSGTVRLPIWLEASSPTLDFTLVDGNAPTCGLKNLDYVQRRQYGLDDQLDVYFVARRLIEVCVPGSVNRLLAEEAYLKRSCDLARSNAYIRLDPTARDLLLDRRSNQRLVDMANRAPANCVPGKSGDI